MDKLNQEIQQLLGISLSPRQANAFKRFETLLVEWNEKFNLTAIREPEVIRSKHFLDSLSCLLVMRDPTPNRLIDVGTGAGFPGIPIKIMTPSLQLTLVESVGKKAEFCRLVAQQLNLENTEVIQARAEELGLQSGHREQYDWVVARAVANLPTLAEYLLPLARIGGSVLAQKGDSGPAEAQSAARAIQLLGGQLRKVHKVSLPGIAEDRYLVVIDKIATTPPGYPRRVGLPTKRPIH
jgi:16S rRNA (guanine527-N7)-methyltransferase